MITFNPNLLPKVRSRALLDACQYMPCALRISSCIPGHACSGQDTVVGAHLPVIGKGVGTKVSDLFVVAACFNCHELLDGRDKRGADYLAFHRSGVVLDRMLRGLAETQSRWVQMGLLHIEDEEIIS